MSGPGVHPRQPPVLGVVEPPVPCDIRDCERPAEFAYLGPDIDLHLCYIHADAAGDSGWTRIQV